MSKFELGNKVKNVNTNEVGYIIKVLPIHRGEQRYRVKYDDRENDEKSKSLELDADLSDPFERIRLNIFGHYTEYLKDNTSFKIKSSNNSTISSLKASKTLFRPYQFKPLLKFLNSDNRRILIADEVGLGKTIEAGHIMLELKARGEFHNALVICPMSLMEKWKTELNEKFGLDFIKIDDKEQLIQELRYHSGYVRAVLNYEKMRVDSDLVNFIEERGTKFSLIVCDESHRLRNDSTQYYKGAKNILKQANGVVFMSATPIMIKKENLFNQLHLLDPNVYNQKEIFLNNDQLNTPFVKALSLLHDGHSFKIIKNMLETSRVVIYNTVGKISTPTYVYIDEYFKDYPIYQEIKQILSGEDSRPIRAKLQSDLSEMNPMSTIFSRTIKKDVTKDWSQAVRNPHTLSINLSEEESLAYKNAIKKYTIEKCGVVYYDEYDRPQEGALGLVTLRRQLASSVWATLIDEDNLDSGIDEYSEYEDAKFNELLVILDRVFKEGEKKIIIFAIFRKTIKYLNIRLRKAGYKAAVIYGSSKINKFEVLQQFKDDDSIQVLLSSEVGSEGLDMQFCSCLVNYDLPWNPMVVEQRIGRVDRFGQKSPKVNLYTLVLTDTIVEKIYTRLLDRIGIFRESIGDLEAILDIEMEQSGKRMTIKKALSSIESDLYSSKLTEKEAEAKEKNIEQAIENEKLQLKEIEEGLTNSLTNDYYFQDEIKKIERNNSYVTKQELKQFVVQLMKDYFTTCELKENSSNLCTLCIPKSDSRILLRFLNDYQPINEDSKRLFAEYKSKVEDKGEILLTFDQEEAFNDKTLSYVNIYHPIIQAGIKMYEKTENKSYNTFFFEIDSKYMPEEIHKGKYILGIYKVSVSKKIYDEPTKTDFLYPILYDIENREVIHDQELAEIFMGKAQICGRYSPLTEDKKLSPEYVDGIRGDLKDEIEEYVDKFRDEQAIKIENQKKMRYQQTLQHFEFQIANAKQNLDNQQMLLQTAELIGDDTLKSNAERILPVMRSNLQTLIKNKEEELERINKDIHLKVTEEPKSLNLVQIV